MREFSDGEGQDFSSFAHLVGLTRGLDLAFQAFRPNGIASPRHVYGLVDTCIAAWCALLPPKKRNLLRDDGTVDHQLFMANMWIAV